MFPNSLKSDDNHNPERNCLTNIKKKQMNHSQKLKVP